MPTPRNIQNVSQGDPLYDKVDRFVERMYLGLEYITRFDSSPDEYIVAMNEESRIIGAIGVFFGSFDELPSIKSGIYIPDNGALRDQARLVEISRFAVPDSDPHVSKALIWHLYTWLYSQKYRYALAVMQGWLIEHLIKNLKIPISPYHAEFHLENVPDNYRGYFEHIPPPQLYYFSMDMLSGIMAEIAKEIHAKIGTSFLSSGTDEAGGDNGNTEGSDSKKLSPVPT